MASFVRVVEKGSISAVAREAGVGQSTVSRHIQELEAAVGVPLLSRTTRRVSLTPEGGRYYGKARAALAIVEQAGEEARSGLGDPAGTIRVSCAAAFGVMHVCRLIFLFQDRYPEIKVDLSLTDERVDLVREGVDIALRLGPLADSSMRLRSLGRSERLLVGATGYAARHGGVTRPDDIERFACIRMTNILGSGRLRLTGRAGQQHEVRFSGSFSVDHGLAAREALIAGRGIAPAHRWLVEDLIENGQLEHLLPDHSLEATPLSMLLVPERSTLARVRLLSDFLANGISKVPGIQKS